MEGRRSAVLISNIDLHAVLVAHGRHRVLHEGGLGTYRRVVMMMMIWQ